MLSDEKEAVRAAGAEALGQIGLPAAAPALKKALKDDSAEVVFSAASALFELKDPAAYEVYFAVLTGERKSGEGLVQSQLDLLKDPQALAKIGFETGIGFIPFGGIGYKAVKAFTADKTSPVRAAAAQKLVTGPRPEDHAGAGQRVEGRQVDGPGRGGQRTRQARRPKAGRRHRAAARRRARGRPLQRGSGGDPVDPVRPAYTVSPIGSARRRLPVAVKMALHKAGAMGGTPGSPTPAGGASLGTICTSISRGARPIGRMR